LTDAGGNVEQELIRVERFQQVVDGLQEARGYTTLESWQLRDVVEGRVSPEAMIVYHTVQSFGRSLKPCWPGNAKLAAILKVTVRSVQRSLAQLDDAGWIVRERVQRQVDKQFYRVITCQRSRGGATSRVAVPGGVATPDVMTGGDVARHTNHHHPELPPDGEHPAATPSVAEVCDAQSAPRATPDEPLEEPPKKAGEPPAWAVDFARELLEVYPHGVRENGRLRKPSSTEVVRKLLAIFRGKRAGTDGHDDLRAAIMRGARAEAAVAPPVDDQERRFIPGLEVWLNKRRWEDPPQFAGKGGATVRPNSPAPTDARSEDRKQAEHMQRVIEEQGPLPHQVKRLNLFLARLGEPLKFLHVLEPASGATGPATGHAPDGGRGPATPGPTAPGRTQPRASLVPQGAPLAGAVEAIRGAVTSRPSKGSGRAPVGS
jgi:hypothetical protein